MKSKSDSESCSCDYATAPCTMDDSQDDYADADFDAEEHEQCSAGAHGRRRVRGRGRRAGISASVGARLATICSADSGSGSGSGSGSETPFPSPSPRRSPTPPSQRDDIVLHDSDIAAIRTQADDDDDDDLDLAFIGNDGATDTFDPRFESDRDASTEPATQPQSPPKLDFPSQPQIPVSETPATAAAVSVNPQQGRILPSFVPDSWPRGRRNPSPFPQTVKDVVMQFSAEIPQHLREADVFDTAVKVGVSFPQRCRRRSRSSR